MSEQSIALWGRFEYQVTDVDDPRHFTDTELSATFTCGEESRTVWGFYNGNGQFILRFMPDIPGVWHYRISSNIPSQSPVEGTFTCVPETQLTGPVQRDGDGHFRYANGNAFYPFGTTAYVWNYQPDDIQQKTLASLAASPFNKIRMCVFPKHYRYNLQEPMRFPFPGTLDQGFDFTRFDTTFFAQLESQIQKLDELNIEVDLILFHPYDRWGFSAMSQETDRRYLRYVVARLGWPMSSTC